MQTLNQTLQPEKLLLTFKDLLTKKHSFGKCNELAMTTL